MRLFFAAVLLVACAGAHAHTPEASRLDGSDDRILLVTPAPRLGIDLPGLNRGAEALALTSEPATAAGPRGRAAWRGAKHGFLIGAGLGVAATAVAAVIDAARGDCEYVCRWQVATAVAIPFTVITTITGAGLGFARAEAAERVPQPSPAPTGAETEQAARP